MGIGYDGFTRFYEVTQQEIAEGLGPHDWRILPPEEIITLAERFDRFMTEIEGRENT